MDAELKQKWIDALRSGKYKQGQCALRSVADRFCCLGVLCDVVNPEGWIAPRGKNVCYYHTDEPCNGFLHPEVAASAGLSKADQHALTEKNDSECLTFAQIADYIEANL